LANYKRSPKQRGVIIKNEQETGVRVDAGRRIGRRTKQGKPGLEDEAKKVVGKNRTLQIKLSGAKGRNSRF